MQNFRKHFILFILGASCSSYLSPELTQEEGKKARPISARLQEVIQRLELLKRQCSDSFSNVADLKEHLKDGASGILKAIHEDDEENRLPEDVHRDINSMLKPSMIKLIALTQYAQWEDLAARIKTAEESLESFKKKYEHELARVHGPAHEKMQSDQMHEEPAVENDDAQELKEDNEEHQIMAHEQDADHEHEAIEEHKPDAEDIAALTHQEMSEVPVVQELASVEKPASIVAEQTEMSKPGEQIVVPQAPVITAPAEAPKPVESVVMPQAQVIHAPVEAPKPVESVVTPHAPVEAPKPVEAIQLPTSMPSAIPGSVMPGFGMPAADIAKPLEIPGPSVTAEPAAMPQAQVIPVPVEGSKPVEPVVTPSAPVEAPKPVEAIQLPTSMPSGIPESVMPGFGMPINEMPKPLEIPSPSVVAEPAAVMPKPVESVTTPQAPVVPAPVETQKPVEPVVTPQAPVEAPKPVEAPVEPTQLAAPISSEPSVTAQEVASTQEPVTEEVVDDTVPGDTVPEEPLDMPV